MTMVKKASETPEALPTLAEQVNDSAIVVPEPTTGTAEVYAAIARVVGSMSKVGIAKDRQNKHQGYAFRGIDDVYNALSPMLAEHGLVVIPRFLHRDTVERASNNGGALFYTTVTAEFDFVSSKDGSMHTARTFGEAMDSGDKATNKAMSAAYKYAAFQTFCIPTEGDNDSENHTHDVAPKAAPVRQPVPEPLAPPYNRPAPLPAQNVPGDKRLITEPQQKRIFALAKAAGVPTDNLKAMLALSGLESTADISREKYTEFCDWVQAGGKLPEPTGPVQPAEFTDEPPFLC